MASEAVPLRKVTFAPKVRERPDKKSSAAKKIPPPRAAHPPPRPPPQRAGSPSRKPPARSSSPVPPQTQDPEDSQQIPTSRGVTYSEWVMWSEQSVFNRPPTEVGTSAEGLAWLAENAKREGMVSLPCGLMYRVIQVAPDNASAPRLTSHCACHYRSMLHDGTEFDSSYQRDSPAVIAPNEVINGWTIAMQLMGEGDKWELFVPSELAYGDAGRGDSERGMFIPPGAALKFELEILQVGGPCKRKPVRPPSPDEFSLERLFSGPRDGLIFTTRLWGTGYYRDTNRPEEDKEAISALHLTGLDVRLDPPAIVAKQPAAQLSLELSPSESAANHFEVDIDPPHTVADPFAAVVPAKPAPTTALAAHPSPRADISSNLFERAVLPRTTPRQNSFEKASAAAAVAGVLSSENHEWQSLQDLMARQREIIEEATQVALQSLLTKLTLPTLKQALSDFDLPADGNREELSQRLSKVLSAR